MKANTGFVVANASNGAIHFVQVQMIGFYLRFILFSESLFLKQSRTGTIKRAELFSKSRPLQIDAQSEAEKELAEHILLMESRLFGLTMDEVRSLAFELAEKNNLAHNFNRTKKRHENNSGEAIFDLLSDLYNQHNFTANRVFNVDETGIRTIPNSNLKVLAWGGGKRQVGGLVPAERGILVTAETCMSASEIYMSTMFVFPRQRAKPELLDYAPPGSTPVDGCRKTFL
ncbi:hypothetical protein ANN_26052 [Periplaneta americana]|uniref:Tc1-like transposase DDE domain-containing protein n=1 Tax=Periplaneta americana TaxID=6978 RepID=A0ABQ8S4W3_PERAM|nr:hypothetical protein ANN_26052 [Periplaneta americana]